jgi:hypothetical protein
MAIYESSVDRPGGEFGVVYVSCFRAVATLPKLPKLQLHEDTRFDKSKISVVGSGYAGLGAT